MDHFKEKRRFPRLDSSHLISFIHYDAGDAPSDTGMGKTLDISRGGVTIQAYRSFPVNTGLELTIAMGEKLVKVRGRVVHSREVDKELYDIGVCFTEIDESDREALAAFFQKTSKE